MAANKYAVQIVLKGHDIPCCAEFPYIVLKQGYRYLTTMALISGLVLLLMENICIISLT